MDPRQMMKMETVFSFIISFNVVESVSLDHCTGIFNNEECVKKDL
jgi:hypothetical protein